MEVKTILSVRDSEGNIVDIPAIKGNKGDKPVKGVDYWTDEDKQEIVNDVINTTGSGSGSGIFTLEIDDNGDLYVICDDGTTPPQFSYDDETGNLYYVIDD